MSRSGSRRKRSTSRSWSGSTWRWGPRSSAVLLYSGDPEVASDAVAEASPRLSAEAMRSATSRDGSGGRLSASRRRAAARPADVNRSRSSGHGVRDSAGLDGSDAGARVVEPEAARGRGPCTTSRATQPGRSPESSDRPGPRCSCTSARAAAGCASCWRWTMSDLDRRFREAHGIGSRTSGRTSRPGSRRECLAPGGGVGLPQSRPPSSWRPLPSGSHGPSWGTVMGRHGPRLPRARARWGRFPIRTSHRLSVSRG